MLFYVSYRKYNKISAQKDLLQLILKCLEINKFMIGLKSKSTSVLSQDAATPWDSSGCVSDPGQDQLHYSKPFHTAPHTHFQPENPRCLWKAVKGHPWRKHRQRPWQEPGGKPEPTRAVLAELPGSRAGISRRAHSL